MIRPYITNCRLPNAAGNIAISVFVLIAANILLDIRIEPMFFLQIIIISALYGIYIFASNNHFDRFADRYNPVKLGRNPVASGQLSVRQSTAQNMVLLGAIISLSAVWFLHLLPLIIVLLINATLYNAVFKSRPLLDLISHAIGMASFAIIPVVAIGLPMDPYLLLVFLISFLASSNVGVLHNQIQDYKADRAAKIRTTATGYGLRFAKRLLELSVAVVMISVLLFYVIFQHWYILILLGIPVLYFTTYRRPHLDKHTEKILLIIILLLLLGMLLG